MNALRNLAASLEAERTWRWVLGAWLLANLASLIGRPLNHDVGYHIHAATRLVEGARLYVDIYEINPPIIFYLNQVPALVAQWTGLSDILTFYIWVALLALAAIALTAHLLAQAPGMPLLLRRLLILALIYHFFIFEPRAFGQREYYFMIFFMPYLAAAFVTLKGGRLPLWTCFAVAVPFAVATAQKPHFLLPFLLVELTLCFQHRGVAPLFRRENWIAGSTMLALVVASLWRHPEFLSDMLPMVMGTYNAFDQNIIVLTYNGRFMRLVAALLAVFMMLRYFLRDRSAKDFALLSVVAALGMIGFYLLQAKGYTYHTLPAAVFMNLGLATLVGGFLIDRNSATDESVEINREDQLVRRTMGWAVTFGLIVAFFGTTASAYVYDPIRAGGQYPKWMRHYTQALLDHAPDQPAFALTSSIYVPYPPVPLAGSRWPYRYNHLWPLPNFYRSDDIDAGEADYRPPARQGALERRFFDTVVEDLLANPPRLVAVETQRYKQGFGYLDFDFVEYFSLDPRFTRLWSDYVLLEDLGQVELYLYSPAAAPVS